MANDEHWLLIHFALNVCPVNRWADAFVNYSIVTLIVGQPNVVQTTMTSAYCYAVMSIDLCLLSPKRTRAVAGLVLKANASTPTYC